MKTVELLDLTDTDLLSMIGQNVVIRLSARDRPDPENDELPFKTVVGAGKLVELQYSADTGGAIAYLRSEAQQPDEIRWDAHEYHGNFTWEEGPA